MKPALTLSQARLKMKKPTTEAQALLAQLDLLKPEIDKYYEDLQKAIEAVHAEVGVDGMFQAADGTVYQIVKPTGTFVTFKDLGFLRTKREGERAGTLSVKKAEEAGFSVK